MSQAGDDESTVKSTVSPLPRDHDRLLYLKKRREKSPNVYMCACERTCVYVQWQRPHQALRLHPCQQRAHPWGPYTRHSV